jgi:hypothetical protein
MAPFVRRYILSGCFICPLWEPGTPMALEETQTRYIVGKSNWNPLLAHSREVDDFSE